MTQIQIHGSIVKAICAVMSTLEAVKKSQNNKHGGYAFASTDDIYAAVTKKMGEVGLVCLALEDGKPEIERFPDKDGHPKPWLKVAYCFVLATEEATWIHPDSRRSLFIQITGPQTFQAAQSYCEKSFLRSLFKIPTGDMDLDSLPEGYEYNPIFKDRPVAPPPPLPPAPPPQGIAAAAYAKTPVAKFDVAQFMTRLSNDLAMAQNAEALGETWAHLEAVMEDNLSRNEREDALGIYLENEARSAAQIDAQMKSPKGDERSQQVNPSA